MSTISHRKGLAALSPALVLLTVFFIPALASGDFYAVPISVAFVAASAWGILLLRDRSFSDRITLYSDGAADRGLLYMVWIFVLAGIFAATAKSIGAVDATVQIALGTVPVRFLPAGIFLATCFISMAIGTSVGTVVALTPVVTALAARTGADTAWMVAIVVGGAFFGDNLSFISDTTIAATQSQGCTMRDKFRTNLRIVLPSAIITLAFYAFGDIHPDAVQTAQDVKWWLAIPYVLVIVLALCGMKVLTVLVIGTVCCWIMGLFGGSTAVSLLAASGDGINSMTGLILVTIMAGGLMNLIRSLGGFEYIISALTRRVSGRKGAEAVIALLTVITNICTANNTVAIITVGGIAKDISSRYGITPRRSASLLDTSSCFIQGLLPYGAQLLMASGLAAVSSIEILKYLYYPFFTGAALAVSIIIGFIPRGRERKNQNKI